MANELDEMLQSPWLQVPDDFSERLMLEIERLPQPEVSSQPWEKLQWLTLIGGAILGIVQLSAFIFGIWAASAAG